MNELLLLTAFSGLIAGALVLFLRHFNNSLGLPIAYLLNLLIQHIPGALAHSLAPFTFEGDEYVTLGMHITVIACLAFIVGIVIERIMKDARSIMRIKAQAQRSEKIRFAWYCFFTGWIGLVMKYTTANIPSVGAAIDRGTYLWILGTIVGLRVALNSRRSSSILNWSLISLIYPFLMLVLGGFLSYGSATLITIASAVIVSRVRLWIILTLILLGGYLGGSLYVNYYIGRDAIRAAAWSGASFSEKYDVIYSTISNGELLDLSNISHLAAFQDRLNQNLFIGLAASRIDKSTVEMLYGRSLYEGAIALIPRALWPNKPVKAGSGNLIPEMTGLALDTEETAWGVGSVMEFYINYGNYGVIIGFLFMGWLLSRWDRRCFESIESGDFGRSITYFLPAMALLQPLASLVEITSGLAAAIIAAYGWRTLWERYISKWKK